jgi:hypothetical protein
MSDFDFDELDKAVTGAISSDETDASEASLSSATLQDVEQPAAVVPAEQKAAPAARRSSGRFMDVVHPSSDMRTRTTPAVVPASSSPKQSFIPPVTKSEEVVSTPSVESEDDSDIDALSDSLDAAVGEWTKPLESPFLSDAKVEKRPLGGVGPEPSFSLLEAPEEELKLEAPEEELLLEASLPDPIDFAAQQAALSSETEDTGVEKVTPEPADEPEIEQISQPETPEAAAVVLEPVAIEEPKEEPVGPASITQQYTEVASSTQQSGAIYDTENYHKPLTPVAKNHSSVLTIVWIIILVILGAAAGVGFYLFVLLML